jgi:hypothetical protein
MTDILDDQLVADVAREQVAQISPQELALFRATSKRYFRDREGTLEETIRSPRKDEKLGFGLEAVDVYVMTPYILEISNVVIGFLATEVLKAVQTESSGLVREYIKRMFTKFRPIEEEKESKAPALKHEQIIQVRKLAFEKARQLDLPEEKANLLADSMAGSLAIE